MKTNVSLAALVLILSIVLIEFYSSTKPKHPYAGLNIEQLVEKYGYPLDIHEVITEDGYILTLYRIPHGRNQTRENKTAILFMHGLTQSAADFVNLGPKRALSLLLADKGYDIWLGNIRGNTWSRKHKWLNPDSDGKFWDYSLDEIGYYDVPAFIDYILKQTQQDSLHYIGYSQGTTVFFILGAQKPKYMSKVKLMTALAPSIYLNDATGSITNTIVYFRKVVEFLLIDIFKFGEVLPEKSLTSLYIKHICNENSLFVDLCLQVIFNLSGYTDQVNKNELSLIFSNNPAGASTKQMMHVAQLIESGNLQKYDLGNTENVRKYGQTQPPQYDISKIQTPVALYYSSNDRGVNLKNIERIVKTLPNVVKSYKIPLETFSHNDFINAKNVVDLVYNEVIQEIVKYG